MTDFKSTLHPDAARHFDQAVEALVDLLEDIPPQQGPSKYRDRIPKAQIGSEDVLKAIAYDVDPEGNFTSIMSDVGGKVLGFTGESFDELSRISEGISRIKPFSKVVSEDFILRKLFDWIQDVVSNANSDMTATDYLLEQADLAIEEQEIWILIDDLIMRTKLDLGGVQFFLCTEQNLSPIIDATRSESSYFTDDMISQIRNDWVGRSVGAVTVKAEKDYARDIAWERVKTVCCAMNIFFGASLLPGVVSSLAPAGYKTIPRRQVMSIGDGKLLRLSDREMRLPNDWELTEDLLSLMKSEPLEELDSILNEPKSEFDEILVNVINIYGSALYETELSNKLVMITSSLEALLLKDGNESIVQNVSDRLALLVVRDTDSRIKVVETFKQAYALRSKVSHHGAKVDERKKLRDFFMWTRFGILTALKHHGRFATKADFIKAIDRKKYT